MSTLKFQNWADQLILYDLWSLPEFGDEVNDYTVNMSANHKSLQIIFCCYIHTGMGWSIAEYTVLTDLFHLFGL